MLTIPIEEHKCSIHVVLDPPANNLPDESEESLCILFPLRKINLKVQYNDAVCINLENMYVNHYTVAYTKEVNILTNVSNTDSMEVRSIGGHMIMMFIGTLDVQYAMILNSF